MNIKNTTLQNRSKHKKLSESHTIPSHYIEDSSVFNFLSDLGRLPYPKEHILYSLGVQLLPNVKNLQIKRFLSEYNYPEVEIKNIPKGEFDLLGSAYQFLNSKKENLEKGSFYTGKDVAVDFVKDLDFNNGEIIFDPACGSGSFLFRSEAPSSQIFGVDSDPIAIMLAKFNYFIKFPNGDAPQIFCEDFFSWFYLNSDKRFDYVIGNPPYGANLDLSKIPTEHIISGESFSYFIEFGFWLLKKDGIFRYLLPEAILNVKRHTDIRKFILTFTGLSRIKRYPKKFSGVMSDVYLLELTHKKQNEVLFQDSYDTKIPIEVFQNFKNLIFVHLTQKDISILNKVNSLRKFDLSTSIFGLGVVTGDNKTKFTSENTTGAEAIYTGKEVEKYTLTNPKNFIVFDRSKLQQVAPDAIYRAPSKLVYKTINKYLKVALDTSGSLTSNSANLIIPLVPDLNILIILGLLNSNLYSFLHLKLFGGVNKIAKENLMALPLPELTKIQKSKIENLVKDVIKGGSDAKLQDYINMEIFKLSLEEVKYINSCL
jgi:hypothetical protein